MWQEWMSEKWRAEPEAAELDKVYTTAIVEDIKTDTSVLQD